MQQVAKRFNVLLNNLVKLEGSNTKAETSKWVMCSQHNMEKPCHLSAETKNDYIQHFCFQYHSYLRTQITTNTVHFVWRKSTVGPISMDQNVTGVALLYTTLLSDVLHRVWTEHATNSRWQHKLNFQPGLVTLWGHVSLMNRENHKQSSVLC